MQGVTIKKGSNRRSKHDWFKRLKLGESAEIRIGCSQKRDKDRIISTIRGYEKSHNKKFKKRAVRRGRQHKKYLYVERIK